MKKIHIIFLLLIYTSINIYGQQSQIELNVSLASLKMNDVIHKTVIENFEEDLNDVLLPENEREIILKFRNIPFEDVDKQYQIRIREIDNFFNEALPEYELNQNVFVSLNTSNNKGAIEYNHVITGTKTGFFIVELYDENIQKVYTSTENPQPFGPIYRCFDKVNMVDIPDYPDYKFKIYYTDQIFKKHFSVSNGIDYMVAEEKYLTALEYSLEKNWTKQVVDWELCGVNDDNSIKLPKDDDGYYQVYIFYYNGQENIPIYYGHNKPASSAILGNNRQIFLDMNVYNCYSTLPNLITGTSDNETKEKYTMMYVLSHEFYHGIQGTLLNTSGLTTDETNQLHWLIEGEAQFIQTLLKETFNPTDAEDANLISLLNPSFYTDFWTYYNLTINYFKQHLTKGTELDIRSFTYDYSSFWRFLYEKYTLTNPNLTSDENVKKKLKLMTNINENIISSQNISEINSFSYIKSVIDASLIAGGSSTFENSKLMFPILARNVYFSPKIFNYWEDPNDNDYYNFVKNKAILNNLEDTELLLYNSTPFSEVETINESLSNPFTSYYKTISFSEPSIVSVELNSSPEKFVSKIYVFEKNLDYSSGKIIATYDIPNVLNAKKDINIPPSTDSDNEVRMVIIITRVDDGSNNTNNEFELKISSINGENEDLLFDKDCGTRIVTFKNTSNIPGIYKIYFGDGDFEPLAPLGETEHPYPSSPNTFDVYLKQLDQDGETVIKSEKHTIIF